MKELFLEVVKSDIPTQAVWVFITIAIAFVLGRLGSSLIRRYLAYLLHKKTLHIDAKSLTFRLFVGVIAPLLFVLFAFVTSFTIGLSLSYLPFSRLSEAGALQAVATSSSLAAKLAMIWLIHKLSIFASVGKMASKVIVVFLVVVSCLSFFKVDKEILTILHEFSSQFGKFEVAIYKAILFLTMIVLILWLNKVISEAVRKMLLSTPMSSSIRGLIVKLITVAIFIGSILIALNVAGVDLTSLAMITSAIAVGVGFGLQKIVSNFISGLMISFEGLIREGDIISTETGLRGTVKALRMRYVLLAEPDGRETSIPNDTLITANVANLTHSDNTLRLRVDLTLPYSVNIEEVSKDLVKMMKKSPYVGKAHEVSFQIDDLKENGIAIFLLFWIRESADIIAAKTHLLSGVLNYLTVKDIKIPPPLSKVEFIHKKPPKPESPSSKQ